MSHRCRPLPDIRFRCGSKGFAKEVSRKIHAKKVEELPQSMNVSQAVQVRQCYLWPRYYMRRGRMSAG